MNSYHIGQSMQKTDESAKRLFAELRGILFFAGIRESEDAAHEILDAFLDRRGTPVFLSVRIGKILKRHNIMYSAVRDEVFKLFLCCLSDKKYKNPFVRYQKEMKNCEKFKNVDKCKPGFVQSMKSGVERRFKNLLTNT